MFGCCLRTVAVSLVSDVFVFTGDLVSMLLPSSSLLELLPSKVNHKHCGLYNLNTMGQATRSEISVPFQLVWCQIMKLQQKRRPGMGGGGWGGGRLG